MLSLLAQKLNFFNVIFEGDALNVIREVNSNLPYLSRSGHFIEGIKPEVLYLISYSFVHMSRALNEAAHTLAKSAVINFCNDVWLEDILSCIDIFDIVTREQRISRS
jgi:hypothetical protein